MNNTGCPGRLWSVCPCRCSKPDWTWPWATCSDWRCWTRQMISTGAFWPLLCCTSCENTPQKFTKFLGAMQRVVDSYGEWSLLNTCKMAWGICMKVLEYFHCNDYEVTKLCIQKVNYTCSLCLVFFSGSRNLVLCDKECYSFEKVTLLISFLNFWVNYCGKFKLFTSYLP